MILPAHTQRLIRNRGMAALYGIAAEHDCDLSDVLDILVTAPFSAPLSTTRIPSVSGPDSAETAILSTTPNSPSQPEVPTHATAAQADGEVVASQPSSPSVDLTGLAAHEQGPSPSPSPMANAPEPESRSTVSRQPGSGDFLPKAKKAPKPPKEPKPPRRITNRQRVRECHEAHPDWTAQQVADETGLSKDNVWTIASQIKIKWPDRKASTTEALQRATAKPQEPEAAPDASEAQPSPEQPPATTADDLNERLIALHTAEPTLTRPELARRLGVTVGKVNYRVERLSLDVPHSRRTDDEPFTPEVIPPANPQKPVAPPPPPTGTLTDRVRALHEQHPTWTARMIANELGANVNNVSTLLAQVRGAPSAGPAQRQQFTGRMDMINHYSEVAKRLGKPS